jgi:hypothetical protein
LVEVDVDGELELDHVLSLLSVADIKTRWVFCKGFDSELTRSSERRSPRPWSFWRYS